MAVPDGESVAVRLGGEVVTVRYLGIDTPELQDARGAVECFAAEAAAHNAALVRGRVVELEEDDGPDRDAAGRLLRWVWVVGDDGTTRHVNEELVKFGSAAVDDAVPEGRYSRTLAAAQEEARSQGLGLWGACDGPHDPLLIPTPTPVPTPVPTSPPRSTPTPTLLATPTTAPRPTPATVSTPAAGGGPTPTLTPTPGCCPTGAAIKGNINARGEKIYHLPGGQFYNVTNPEACFVSEADALAAGYRRSQR